eukprot:359153-Chlamydomonas_euryale.AAC.5
MQGKVDATAAMAAVHPPAQGAGIALNAQRAACGIHHDQRSAHAEDEVPYVHREACGPGTQYGRVQLHPHVLSPVAVGVQLQRGQHRRPVGIRHGAVAGRIGKPAAHKRGLVLAVRFEWRIDVCGAQLQTVVAPECEVGQRRVDAQPQPAVGAHAMQKRSGRPMQQQQQQQQQQQLHGQLHSQLRLTYPTCHRPAQAGASTTAIAAAHSARRRHGRRRCRRA